MNFKQCLQIHRESDSARIFLSFTESPPFSPQEYCRALNQVLGEAFSVTMIGELREGCMARVSLFDKARIFDHLNFYLKNSNLAPQEHLAWTSRMISKYIRSYFKKKGDFQYTEYFMAEKEVENARLDALLTSKEVVR